MRLLIECDKTSAISLRRLSSNVNNVYHINAHSVACKSMKQQSLIANRIYVIDRRVISIAAYNKCVPIIVNIFLELSTNRARREGWTILLLFFFVLYQVKTLGYAYSSICILLNIVEQEIKDRLALEIEKYLNLRGSIMGDTHFLL